MSSTTGVAWASRPKYSSRNGNAACAPDREVGLKSTGHAGRRGGDPDAVPGTETILGALGLLLYSSYGRRHSVLAKRGKHAYRRQIDRRRPKPFRQCFLMSAGGSRLAHHPEHSPQDFAKPAGVRRLADFTDISAGRAPCDRGTIPQLSLVLYMTRAQRRTAQAPSMLHRSGNSPLHPSEILHRPAVAACSSRCGQAPARDHAEPDCDRSEAQISRSQGGSRVAPIVLVAPLHRSLVRGRSWAASSPWQWGRASAVHAWQ
jgi:hypothetical protein